MQAQQDLRAVAATFAQTEVAPMAALWEAERSMPDTALRRAIGRGLGGLLVPKDLGGAGLDTAMTAEVLSVLARADLGFAFSLVVHNNLVAAIARRGSDGQRRRYVRAMLAGDILGAFCLTEPDVGTDVSAIATRAGRQDDGYVLEGAKAWVTNAASADLFCVYAQAEPGAGARGIAAFLVDRDSPGLMVEPPYVMLGNHAMGTSSLKLDRVLVPSEKIFLPAGEGFRGAMSGIDLARVLLAAMCCGMLTQALELAVTYCSRRHAFGQPLLDFQGLQWQLADVATDLEAARLLADRAALRLDSGESATLAAAHAKKFATRAAMSGVHCCMQAVGAAGLKADRPFGRFLAAAKMAEYLDGTTEVQNIVIGRALRRSFVT